jgi:hypothetical protein
MVAQEQSNRDHHLSIVPTFCRIIHSQLDVLQKPFNILCMMAVA